MPNRSDERRLSRQSKAFLFINELYSQSLILRKVREHDLPFLELWSNSKDAHGEYLTPECMSLGELKEKHKSDFFWNDDSKLYLIVNKDNSLPIGTIQYWRKRGTPNLACVAVKIASPAERRKGFGTEAQKVLIRHLFVVGGFAEIEMHTDIDNVAQQKCLKKLGFEFISSKNFSDHGVKRLGNLYRLDRKQYDSAPEFIYYYD
ncbi:MAG: GNAT family N-acetyltransferase [Deltaproteobacteria bacterium]|nr:GNAT family N-acetyltransferase [Deltaproteobacteria bacterium]